MKYLSARLLAACVAASACTAAVAHHSAAAFNTDAEVTVTGIVAEYSFRNPHVYMTLDVSRNDGSKARVEVESGAASVIGPLGFTRDAVQIGEQVTVHGNPGRRNPEGLLLGRELFRADGTYFPLNIGSRATRSQGDQVAKSLAGTWFPPRTSFYGFLGAANGWPISETGRAAMAVNAQNPTPQKDCRPLGEPALMFYPVAIVLEVFDDRVDMQIDWLDSKRTVWLDGREHPPASETFMHGHSVGHWDGTSLVIDSANFAANPIGLSMQLPSGTGKHLAERLDLSADGKQLTYSGTLTDPEYLAAPVTWSGVWEYRPDMRLSNEPCDLEAAQRFLDD